jgi:hypothetical protein
VSTGLLVHPANNICLGTSSVILDWLGASLREELDGWVRGNSLVLGGGFSIVGFSVDLGDNYVWLVDEVGSSLLPYWCKRFAV